MLFDAGPEEDLWECNARRLGVDLASIERIQLDHHISIATIQVFTHFRSFPLVHLFRFLSTETALFFPFSNIPLINLRGMLNAISMISSAKNASQIPYLPVIVNLHPSRPDFRGLC